MSDAVAIPDILALLRERLRAERDAESVLQVLRALQRLGLSKGDLVIHLERLRVENDLREDDPDFEERALLALGLIEGDEPGGLRWDAAEQAAIWLAQSLDEQLLRMAVDHAITPSDLLPPRPSDRPPAPLVGFLVREHLRHLKNFEAIPERAEQFRVPKVAFTTRPAALLAPSDRLSYESLASIVEDRLDECLVGEVKWPRRRASPPATDTFAREPLDWDAPYIVKADVASFYERIDHSLLAVFASLRLHVRSAEAQAVEAFLDAVMASSVGLPQGSPASDVFASLYLLPVDERLSSAGWRFIRYADDYYISAETPTDGRLRLARLEGWLQELGLSLNVEKTQVMRRATYERGLMNRSKSLERVRNRVRQMREARLLHSDDSDDVAETLRDAGVDEQVLFDLLYHQTTTLEEVLEEVREQLEPPMVDSYGILFRELAVALEHEGVDEDPARIERDLRQCLVVLAGARRAVRFDLLSTVMQWFPRTVPHVATYLSSVADDYPEEAAALLRRWLRPLVDTDWVTGWLCYAAERSESLRSATLVPIFHHITADARAGWLTRMAASRVLALAGTLDEGTWQNLYGQAPPAVRAELMFSVTASPSIYPKAIAAKARLAKGSG